MDARISDKSERFIRAQVKSGRYRSRDEVVERAIRLLEERESCESQVSEILDDQDRAFATDQDLQRRLQAAGLLSEIKPPLRDLDEDRDRRAVPIQGEPLSETVIRERR